eukprot:GHVR01176407.1.p1 GENE.GHVR01176407.1~~GHVR01176407.1.p1  ORF type:complete len:451 (-),score=83.64 GHVR01176407.1:62-1414(-)
MLVSNLRVLLLLLVGNVYAENLYDSLYDQLLMKPIILTPIQGINIFTITLPTMADVNCVFIFSSKDILFFHDVPFENLGCQMYQHDDESLSNYTCASEVNPKKSVLLRQGTQQETVSRESLVSAFTLPSSNTVNCFIGAEGIYKNRNYDANKYLFYGKVFRFMKVYGELQLKIDDIKTNKLVHKNRINFHVIKVKSDWYRSYEVRGVTSDQFISEGKKKKDCKYIKKKKMTLDMAMVKTLLKRDTLKKYIPDVCKTDKNFEIILRGMSMRVTPTASEGFCRYLEEFGRKLDLEDVKVFWGTHTDTMLSCGESLLDLIININIKINKNKNIIFTGSLINKYIFKDTNKINEQIDPWYFGWFKNNSNIVDIAVGSKLIEDRHFSGYYKNNKYFRNAFLHYYKSDSLSMFLSNTRNIFNIILSSDTTISPSDDTMTKDYERLSCNTHTHRRCN